MVEEEGLARIFRRHQRIADGVRAAVEAWAEAGVVSLNALLPRERSNSVTTVLVAEPHSAPEVRRVCHEQLNVSLGGGLGQLHGKAFRIGHMGDINEPMILGALGAVETAFQVCGIPHGRADMTAAIDALAQTEPHAVAAC